MICPSKSCRAQIPDDSIFCDQCGIQLLKCAGCGRVALGKFCGKCGGKMLPIKKNDLGGEQK
ncbi:MAG: zinc ribbon domain-containing protein [Treponema sp.]|nr:zinc ribbon domain-containing protein [Treponema sp.]